MADRRRLGVFGGSFDPIHVGHLVAAVNVRYALSLDEVLLVVANEPWQKTELREVSPGEIRYSAVAAAVGLHPGISASRLEIDRGGATYTVDTVRELSLVSPEADLFLIVGSDTAANLDTWREPETIADLADLVVVNRPGVEGPVLPPMWRAHHVEIPAIDVSSTELRSRFADGRPLDFLIPDAAADLLRASGLYAGTPGNR